MNAFLEKNLNIVRQTKAFYFQDGFSTAKRLINKEGTQRRPSYRASYKKAFALLDI